MNILIKWLKTIKRPYRGRINYWSHSRLAKWVLTKFGIPIMNMGTSKEWKEYEKKYGSHIGTKITDFFDTVQNIIYYVPDVYYSIKWDLTIRFKKKFYQLPSHLNKWEYYDFDHTLLHSVMGGFCQSINDQYRIKPTDTYKVRQQKFDAYIKEYDDESLAFKQPVHGGEMSIKEVSDLSREIYFWWNYRRKEHWEAVEKVNDELFSNHDIWDDSRDDPKFVEAMKRNTNRERELYEVDTDYMIKVIKMRERFYDW